MEEAMLSTSTDGAMPTDHWPPTLQEAARLFPQYGLLRFLGGGDVGAVFQAVDPADGRTIGIKILPPELTSAPSFANTFARIASQLVDLRHPRIVPVRNFGKTVAGQLFIVSEFIDGDSLRQRIGPARFIATQAYSIVEQICDALHFAHSHGIVHGGLHPGNVFLDRSGGAQVGDFGLGQLFARGVARNGSENYAAPEQLADGAILPRADIFSTGVMLYELFAGELPHPGSRAASAASHANPRIDAVIAKAISAAPEQRYVQAADLMRAIVAVGSLDGMRPSLAAKPSPPVAVAIPEKKSVETSAVAKRRDVQRWSAIGAGAVVAVTAIGFALWPKKVEVPVRPAVSEFPTAITFTATKPAQPPRPKPVADQPHPTEVPKKPVQLAKPALPKTPPGQWMPIAFTEITGATVLPEGGIHLSKGVRLDKYRGKDMALRSVLRLMEEPKGAQLWLRATPQSRVQLTLNWKPICLVQTTIADNKFKTFGEVTAPWAILDERWVTLEFATIGKRIFAAVNDRPVEVKLPSDVLDAGAIGLFSPDAGIRSFEFALLDEVPRENYPEFVKKALDAADALIAKAAAESKEMLPPPAPAVAEKSKVSPDVEQWLAKVDGPLREAYEREVAKPFETALGQLRTGYVQTLERQSAAATSAGKLDEAAVWHAERERFFGSAQNVPPDDNDNPLPTIKTMRANFRAAFARLDHERFDRARAHFAKYDAVLSPNLAALTQRQRLDDAALLKARRDELTREWLAPPVALAPLALGPPLARKSVAAEPPKQALKETIDWLLDYGAELQQVEGTKWSPVIDARLVPSTKISFGVRIDSAKVKTPLTPEDLRKLAGLRNLWRLELNNGFPDSAFDFLREVSGLRRVQIPGDKLTNAIVDTLATLSELTSLQIRNGANFTGKSFDLLAKLPALHEIDIENCGLDDEGASALAKIESLEGLDVRRTKITNLGLAQFAHLRNLKRLEIDHCAGITAEGLAALKGAKNLELVDFLHDGLADFPAAVKALATNCTHTVFTRLRGKAITADQVSALSEWRSLNHVAMPDAEFAEGGVAALATLGRLENLELMGATFADEDVEHLLGLKELRKVNLAGTKITDAGLLKLKALKGIKEINVNNTATTPAGVRQFEKEHPGCRVIRANS